MELIPVLGTVFLVLTAWILVPIITPSASLNVDAWLRRSLPWPHSCSLSSSAVLYFTRDSLKVLSSGLFGVVVWAQVLDRNAPGPLLPWPCNQKTVRQAPNMWTTLETELGRQTFLKTSRVQSTLRFDGCWLIFSVAGDLKAWVNDSHSTHPWNVRLYLHLLSQGFLPSYSPTCRRQ